MVFEIQQHRRLVYCQLTFAGFKYLLTSRSLVKYYFFQLNHISRRVINNRRFFLLFKIKTNKQFIESLQNSIRYEFLILTSPVDDKLLFYSNENLSRNIRYFCFRSVKTVYACFEKKIIDMLITNYDEKTRTSLELGQCTVLRTVFNSPLLPD